MCWELGCAPVGQCSSVEAQMKFRLLLILPVIFLSIAPWSPAQTNFCKLTAQNALGSCQVGAQSDFWLEVGKCDNVSNPTKREACEQQASSDFKDELDLCESEDSVRKTACQRLGPQPYDPAIDPANFVDKIDNPYFPLVPGTVFIYEGQTAAGLEHDEFFVTDKTKKILGVTTVEVHDTVTTNGKLTEDTLDWFAQDKEGNVWYFGENTMELINGRPSTLEGTFVAGVNRAKPGIIMEAHSVVHDFYRQEFDLGNAEDFADVKSLSDTVTVPYGTFTHCLR